MSVIINKLINCMHYSHSRFTMAIKREGRGVGVEVNNTWMSRRKGRHTGRWNRNSFAL